MNKEILDYYDFGPIYDRDGNMDCRNKFGMVLESILTSFELIADDQKVRYQVLTILNQGTEDSERENISETATFSELKELYKKLHGKPFDINEYQEEQQFRWDDFEKEAQRKSAWGGYSNHIHELNRRDREKEFIHSIKDLPEKEKQQKIEEFKSGNFIRLHIG